MATPKRKKLPKEREGVTHHFTIGKDDGYVTVSWYKDGRLAEVFVKMAKVGTTVSGFVDAWAMTLSIALQHGVPLQPILDKLKYTRFDPQGPSGSQFGIVTSVVDYLAKWLEWKFPGGRLADHPSSSSTKLLESSQ